MLYYFFIVHFSSNVFSVTTSSKLTQTALLTLYSSLLYLFYTAPALLFDFEQLHDISVRKIHSTGTLPLLVQKNPRLYPFLLNGCDVDRHENDDPFYQEWKINGRKNWKNKKLNVVDGGVVGEPICMIENVKNVKTLLDGICVKDV